MRSYSFSFNNIEDSTKAFEALKIMFGDSEDFKKKKIVFCRVQDKEDSFKIFMSIEDTVPGSFSVIVTNAFDKNLKNVFTAVKADCKDINIELPLDCQITSWYEPDPAVKKE